jgi:hypothetical protein
MADVVTTSASLNGFFKKKYAAKVAEIIPENVKFSGRLPFSKAQRIGDSYNMPIELALEQGVTYAAAGAGAFALDDAQAGEMKNALLDGAQYLIKGMLDYESAAKAIADGEEAFGNAGARLVKRMTKSLYKRIELTALYGKTSLGTVLNTTGSAGTTLVMQISVPTWAMGIWTGMRNAKLDVYSDITYATKRNVASSPNNPYTVTAVDMVNRKITATAGLLADQTAVVAGDIITFGAGAAANANYATAQMAGLDKIATNTGVLFTIDGSVYELFSGNTYDSGSAAFSLTKLNAGIAFAAGKGLDEKATFFGNPKTWGNICSDQAALRKFDVQYKPAVAENGFRTLSFYSQNGEIEVVPHTMIKEGEAFIVPMDRFKKIGATDVTFQVPGRGQDEFFKHMEAKAGYELRAYANLALFCEGPGLCTKVINIVNT